MHSTSLWGKAKQRSRPVPNRPLEQTAGRIEMGEPVATTFPRAVPPTSAALGEGGCPQPAGWKLIAGGQGSECGGDRDPWKPVAQRLPLNASESPQATEGRAHARPQRLRRATATHNPIATAVPGAGTTRIANRTSAAPTPAPGAVPITSALDARMSACATIR